MLNKSEPQTLEEQKTELEFSMKESDYQTALRKEMEKIRKEGKITDRSKKIKFNGKAFKSIRKLAKFYKVSSGTLAGKLSRGISIKKALGL